MNRRLGIVRISGALLDQSNTIGDMVYKLKLVIIRAEHLFGPNIMEYQALSPLFDELPMGEMIPEYVVTPHENKGYIRYTVEKSDINIKLNLDK